MTFLLRSELHLDRLRDIPGRLHLQSQNISNVAVVDFCPQVLIARRIDELRPNPDRVSDSFDCTFD